MTRSQETKQLFVPPDEAVPTVLTDAVTNLGLHPLQEMVHPDRRLARNMEQLDIIQLANKNRH